MDRIILEPRSVQEALEAVFNAAPLHPGHPLLAFLLVRTRLQSPEYLSGAHVELHAVREVLETCLFAVLRERQLGDDDLAAIQQDFQVENPYLEAYSLLYYRFLRPDLSLTIEQIATQVNLVRRSLQRRHEDGIAYLTQDLIKRETQFRRHQKSLLLRSRIPYPAERALYGRDWLIERLVASLAQGAVLVVGLPGVGKTSVIAAVAHKLLPTLDDLFWINLLPGADLLSQVAAEIAGINQEIYKHELRAYLSTYQTLLVLEDLQPSHFVGLAELRHAHIICTADQVYPGWGGAIIEVPPLERDVAKAFFTAIAGDMDESIFPHAFDYSGGVPGAMREYLLFQRFLPGNAASFRLQLYNYYADLWNALSRPLQQLWFLLSLLENESLPSEIVIDILGLKVTDFVDLVTRQVFFLDNRAYRLTPSARAFVQHRPDLDLQADQFVDAAVERQGELSATQLAVWLALLANGLAHRLTEDTCARLLKYLVREVTRVGLWKQWSAALNACRLVLSDSPYWRCWFALESARLQRWQGLFADDLRAANELVQQAGHLGYFDIYAQGLLELSMVLFYKNIWNAAVDAAADAEQLFKRMGESNLISQAQLARARALIHIDPGQALNLATNMVEPSAAAASIACEAALLLKQISDAVTYGSQAVKLSAVDSPNYGRALSLLAMSLGYAGENRMALDYQEQAINHLTLTSDMVGLARAYNNLGVLHHALGESEQAQAMWENALKLVLMLQDATSLEAIRYNMQLQGGQARRLSEY